MSWMFLHSDAHDVDGWLIARNVGRIDARPVLKPSRGPISLIDGQPQGDDELGRGRMGAFAMDPDELKSVDLVVDCQPDDEETTYGIRVGPPREWLTPEIRADLYRLLGLRETL